MGLRVKGLTTMNHAYFGRSGGVRGRLHMESVHGVVNMCNYYDGW